MMWGVNKTNYVIMLNLTLAVDGWSNVLRWARRVQLTELFLRYQSRVCRKIGTYSVLILVKGSVPFVLKAGAVRTWYW